MTETFTRWNAADHLKTPEDVRLYVQACADEDPGDGSLICAALNDVARAGNMAGLARKAGASRQGLYKALSPDGQPDVRDGPADHASVGATNCDWAARLLAMRIGRRRKGGRPDT